METLSDNKQDRILKISAYKYRVRYLYEQVEETDPETGEKRTVHRAEEVEVNNPNDPAEVRKAITRDRYPADVVEELLSGFARGENVIEFMRYQNWRKLAAHAAAGAFYKTEFEDLINSEIIEVQLPFSETLQGGKHEALADYALKAKVNTYPDPVTNTVRVYLSYLTPEHRSLLENDNEVTITKHKGLKL
ncbi:MAG TPA: hypothetical protein VJ909_07115 [Prolixibacteraceae bacterium]|nr:hypothetical protein [Prolixibacteraceae bacterium]